MCDIAGIVGSKLHSTKTGELITCMNLMILHRGPDDGGVLVGDGVGLSTLYASGYGMPIVTMNNMDEHFPEAEALREGITSWYFKEDDVQDFAKKVVGIKNRLIFRGRIFNHCISFIEESFTPVKHCEFIEAAIKKYIMA
ncbi:MAG: hypothetical protein O3B75_06615 [Planctomycetota bacterium]|nr:hypothetical protein [Planctomycetota bacterium]